jgi:hypothetical protein
VIPPPPYRYLFLHGYRKAYMALGKSSGGGIAIGSYPKPPSQPQVMKVNLWLRVERHNRFARGTKRAGEQTPPTPASRIATSERTKPGRHGKQR